MRKSVAEKIARIDIRLYRRLAALLVAPMLCASPAHGQDARSASSSAAGLGLPAVWSQWGGQKKTLPELLSDGYEVKTGIFRPDMEVLYLQKQNSLYRCPAVVLGKTLMTSHN